LATIHQSSLIEMTSDEPPQSPFQPGYLPAGSPFGEPGSPFAPDYDPDRWAEPRLGILHLLGATTCVAVYFGLARTAQLITAELADRPDGNVVFEASSVWYGLGSGIALSGLLLWVARWRRAVPFPRHPGEYMLIVQAIICVLVLGLHFLSGYLRLLSEQETSAFSVYFWQDKIWVALYLVHALLWMVADIRIGIRRWQTFFFLCAGVHVLSGFLNCAGMDRFVAAHYLLYVLLSIVLVVIVVRDHRQGMRYPWSHWLGVGIRFWFTLLSLVWFVLETFFQHWLQAGS
jgi:hypothetical protein